ncbi:MAG: TetR/AcrR family transcriptional regulator [Methanosarcina vacuolata]|jgi:AcrR family transcriptional regulator|uniref:TetR/AcrR family transcriptional regulator n=1 Tax=Methanosarcina sp. DH1 TaxID=2605695 RepID=UPI001E649A68|nr:TetR/AcrR family transcriptional regulator [Methanosarcina sp. DH1]MCC4768019.1 TetR family transcriptional regulator [Methanosarcina sp. DH1]MDY0130366.1 TetR/AcrR family transcriptional regulator [Methanosarcina vacuolata]
MRSFTDEEREIIRRKIIDRGKDCFARYGIKKTSIEDLTKDLGIAKSSFYSFFSSKEDLFLQIFKEEREALKDNLLENSFLKYRTEPDKAVRAYLHYLLNIVNNHPVWKKVFIEKEYVELTIFLSSEEKIRNIHKENVAMILPFFEEWADAGLLIDKDARILAETTFAVFSLTRFRNEIGDEDFPKIMDFFIDLLTENIVKKDE